MSDTWVLSRQMERERQRGRVEARIDLNNHETVPMQDRDAEKWASLNGCEQAGYWSHWNRQRRKDDKARSDHEIHAEREARDSALEAEAEVGA